LKIDHRKALLKSFLVLQTAKNNAHQQQQNTHTPYHNQYEKSNSLKDVKSKDVNNVLKKNYKICVIEIYARMKMFINILMKSSTS
jgi:hypothetical protein